MPILFPITFFTLINMYVSERFLFAYYYRKPPVFGGGMNDGALKILTYAPWFMICFGYWQLGNRQIFFNEISEKLIKKEEYDPNHKLFDYSKGLNHTALFLLYIPLFGFFRPFIKLLRRIASFFKFFNQPKGIDLDWNIDLNIDEDLGNYWNCLRG